MAAERILFSLRDMIPPGTINGLMAMQEASLHKTLEEKRLTFGLILYRRRRRGSNADILEPHQKKFLAEIDGKFAEPTPKKEKAPTNPDASDYWKNRREAFLANTDCVTFSLGKEETAPSPTSSGTDTFTDREVQRLGKLKEYYQNGNYSHKTPEAKQGEFIEYLRDHERRRFPKKEKAEYVVEEVIEEAESGFNPPQEPEPEFSPPMAATPRAKFARWMYENHRITEK